MDRPQKNRTVIIISLLTIVTGITVMVGWIFNIPVLQSMVPGFVAMKFNPALCFILFGSALLSTQYQTKKYNTLPFFILSLFGTLIALITLSQDFFHINTGIDQLFITDQTARSHKFPFPGRMAFNSSVNFILLGLGFLGLTTKNRSVHIISQCIDPYLSLYLYPIFCDMMYDVLYFCLSVSVSVLQVL